VIYLTPNRYRSQGTGVDLTSKSDADLRAILTQAATLTGVAVNAPTGYSFLGGTITNEEHIWETGNKYKAPSGRLWPYYRPVKSISNVQINVTKTQYISFDEDQLFFEQRLGYVEPVAAPNTTALFTSVPPWLLTAPIAYIDYEYGFQFDVTDEIPASLSGGVLQAANQFWYTDEDVILKLNGATVDPDDYDVDYTEGTITPTTPPDDEDEFTISYSHKVPPEVAMAQSFIANDIVGGQAIAAAGMIGLSGISVEEVELRQSSKVNFAVQPINAAAAMYLAPVRAMFVSMR